MDITNCFTTAQGYIQLPWEPETISSVNINSVKSAALSFIYGNGIGQTDGILDVFGSVVQNPLSLIDFGLSYLGCHPA